MAPDRLGTAAAVRRTRQEWVATLALLDTIVEGPAEPGSVLNQLRNAGVQPPIDDTLRVTVAQGTEFVRAALAVAKPKANGTGLSPIAPLARSGLLAFSKVLAIATPLGEETRGIGPALQHHHDGLVDAFIEQDRHATFDAKADSSKVWTATGRRAILDNINALRAALNIKPVKVPKGPTPRDKLVTEGSWIAEGQRCCDLLRDLEGDPSGEVPYRIQWAWHRGSVVAHAGFSAVAMPQGLSFVYLNGEDASALIRHAVELAAAAQRALDRIWCAELTPQSFSFNADYRLPRSAPTANVSDSGN